MPPGDMNGDWTEWSKHVLKELERLSDEVKALRESLGDMKVAHAIQKGKSLAYGTVGGVVASLLVAYLVRAM